MSDPDRTPVLVGVGTATRREADHRQALEPLDLMLEAVRHAGRDCGAADALAGVQHIAVPRGRWRYSNPAGAIARDIGAQATTVLSTVGVLQQSLIGLACERIARGQLHTTLVAGADAGYRLLRAQIAGETAPERALGDAPDVLLAPKDELRHPVEKRAGLNMPVGLYALIDSAFRAQHKRPLAAHRDRLAKLGERFSEIAAANPHAWNRTAVDAVTLRDASERNPMQAFPYTRLHCSTWNVDQAAALLFCSAARAAELGVPTSRWVYPLASTESNHMVPVSARADLAAVPGARTAGLAALAAGGIAAHEVDLIELYSCFPIAVEAYAAALGLPPHRDLTVTGGMAFAGGPYNNYLLQATVRVAELLRAGAGRTALVSSVSGVLTKQGFGLWSVDAPQRPFVNQDVSELVARQTRTVEVLESYTGDATIAGCTVLHARGAAPRAVALVDTPDGQRAMVDSDDAHLVARLQDEDWVGRRVHVAGDRMSA